MAAARVCTVITWLVYMSVEWVPGTERRFSSDPIPRSAGAGLMVSLCTQGTCCLAVVILGCDVIAHAI